MRGALGVGISCKLNQGSVFGILALPSAKSVVRQLNNWRRVERATTRNSFAANTYSLDKKSLLSHSFPLEFLLEMHN